MKRDERWVWGAHLLPPPGGWRQEDQGFKVSPHQEFEASLGSILGPYLKILLFPPWGGGNNRKEKKNESLHRKI